MRFAALSFCAGYQSAICTGRAVCVRADVRVESCNSIAVKPTVYLPGYSSPQSRGGSCACARVAGANITTHRIALLSFFMCRLCRDLAAQVLFAARFGKPLDRITQHGARHRAVMLGEKCLEHADITLADFAQHPARRLVNQVVLITQQKLRNSERRL